MDYSYHTHTFHCGHASDTPEEYIKTAIEGGIKYMGFSDHAPMVFDNGWEAGFRVPMAELDDYISELRSLREKYKNEIEIAIGFEIEYYPEHFDKSAELLKAHGGEYFILGQHYVVPENINNTHNYDLNKDEEKLNLYVIRIIEAMKTGKITYVAHPDILGFVGDESLYCEKMTKLCRAAKEYNVPLEINFLGIRTQRRYPREQFWEIAGKIGSPVTFGFDAHQAVDAADIESLAKAEELVKKFGLNYIGRPEIKHI